MIFKVVGVAHGPTTQVSVTLHSGSGDEMVLTTNPGVFSIGQEVSLTTAAEPEVAPEPETKEEPDASSTDAAAQ